MSFIEIDKRELVNIDLYHHEIKVIDDQLNKLAERNLSKEIQHKVKRLKKSLEVQKIHLETLRKNCEPGDLNTSKEKLKEKEKMRNKSFFEKLNDFENLFKAVRQEANDLVNEWALTELH